MWKSRHGLQIVQHRVIPPNEVGGPGGQRCKKVLCRQRIVLVLTSKSSRNAHRTLRRSGSRSKAAVASCAGRVCGQKRLGVANNGKKQLFGGIKKWWLLFKQRKQSTRHVFRAEPTLLCIRCTLRRESPQPSRWKSPKCNLGRFSGINWIPITNKPTDQIFTLDKFSRNLGS